MSFDARPDAFDATTETAAAAPAHHAAEVSARPFVAILVALIAIAAGLVAMFGVQGIFLTALGLVPVLALLLVIVAKG